MSIEPRGVECLDRRDTPASYRRRRRRRRPTTRVATASDDGPTRSDIRRPPSTPRCTDGSDDAVDVCARRLVPIPPDCSIAVYLVKSVLVVHTANGRVTRSTGQYSRRIHRRRLVRSPTRELHSPPLRVSAMSRSDQRQRQLAISSGDF